MIREGHPEDKLTISTKYELPILENELPVNVEKMWGIGTPEDLQVFLKR